MSTDTITVDNFKFELELSPSQIKIKLTDTTSYDMYEGIVNEDDIYVKPIQKFYSMIIKSLNKEPNYNFKINDKKTTLICTFSYCNEMVDIDEHLKFTKLEDHKTKELLLIDRIKYLEEQVNILTFCYRNDPGLGIIESFSFDINSTKLDFRHCSSVTSYMYYYKSLEETNFNKFKKVKKIITNSITYGYMSDLYDNPDPGYHKIKLFRIYNARFICMPNVIEIIIHLDANTPIENLKNCNELKINPACFPNLEKISYVIDGYLIPTFTFMIYPLDNHNQGYFKKLNIISLQNFLKTNVVINDIINKKLYAQAHGIKLEIT